MIHKPVTVSVGQLASPHDKEHFLYFSSLKAAGFLVFSGLCASCSIVFLLPSLVGRRTEPSRWKLGLLCFSAGARGRRPPRSAAPNGKRLTVAHSLQKMILIQTVTVQVGAPPELAGWVRSRVPLSNTSGRILLVAPPG